MVTTSRRLPRNLQQRPTERRSRFISKPTMEMLMQGGVKRSNSKQFTSRDPLVVGPIFPIFFPKIPPWVFRCCESQWSEWSFSLGFVTFCNYKRWCHLDHINDGHIERTPYLCAHIYSHTPITNVCHCPKNDYCFFHGAKNTRLVTASFGMIADDWDFDGILLMHL